MNKEERNKRKQKWMAHGFAMGKIISQAGDSITAIMYNVRDNDSNEFEAFTDILTDIETVLHECGIAQFTEKYMLFQLADAEFKK